MQLRSVQVYLVNTRGLAVQPGRKPSFRGQTTALRAQTHPVHNWMEEGRCEQSSEEASGVDGRSPSCSKGQLSWSVK